MDKSVQGDTEASDETVPAGRLKILRVGVFTRAANPEQFPQHEDESVGFDPYDTASLYVEKT